MIEVYQIEIQERSNCGLDKAMKRATKIFVTDFDSGNHAFNVNE